jgi:hypothetical protein
VICIWITSISLHKMINVIHKDCGEVAFYFKVRVYSGETIRSSNVINIDGTLAQTGDQIICGNCGARLNHLGSHNIEQKEQHWTDWFIIDD